MSDKLFQKRKKSEADLKRKAAKQPRLKRFLMVCEGEKTEPNYLAALRDHLGINRQNLVVYQKTEGSDPKRVVDLALAEYRRERAFDSVFCVFDRDTHAHYEGSLERIRSFATRRRDAIPLVAINSVPCFEIWYLLHFHYSSKPCLAEGKKSVCDCLIRDLKKVWPDYDKPTTDYSHILEKTEEAMLNAQKLERHCEEKSTQNPFTQVHKMVNIIKGLHK